MNARAHLRLPLIWVALMVSACTSIASYDAGLATGLGELQSRVARLFDDLQRTAGTPAGGWEQHAALYKDIRAQIDSVRALAAVRPHNELTLRALDLFEDNLANVEAVHREGVAANEVPVLRTLLDTQVRMLIELENGKKVTS